MSQRTFICGICGSVIAHNLRLLVDKNELDVADGHELLPAGRYFESDGEFEPEEVGDYLVNLKDLQHVKRHTDPGRLNGCCGLDGCDGFNILCENNHEIGTERSDCWLSHHAILSRSKVKDA